VTSVTDAFFDAGRWFAAISERTSRRAYASPPSETDLAELAAVATAFTPFEDARAILVPLAPPNLFSGIIGSYGRVSGPCAAIVFLVGPASPAADTHLGYTGEALVLEAQARGLGTCWMSGTFSRAVARTLPGVRSDEAVRAVSPLGVPLEDYTGVERLVYGKGRPRSRKPLDAIAPGVGSWPEWAAAGVRAAQVAPSAVNRQPWLFRYDDDSIVVATRGGVGTARLDCGIAMLHFELGARSEGSDGAWEPLPGDDVARWVPFD
jgi:nitroreductase